MADICDLAEKEIDTAIALQIAAARRSTSATPTFECVECGDPSLANSRYCCAECRDDGERRQRIARIEGKP